MLFILISCNKSKKGKFNFQVKSVKDAKVEIPITHGICWSSSNDNLVIDSFRIALIESNLNMFYDTSLLSYTVYGHAMSKKNSVIAINQIHIAERLNNDTAINCDGIIEITPILTLEVAENKKGSNEYFHFTNEIALSSIHFGENIFQFICLNKKQTISLFQNK